jgi:hypothetical protein
MVTGSDGDDGEEAGFDFGSALPPANTSKLQKQTRAIHRIRLFFIAYLLTGQTASIYVINTNSNLTYILITFYAKILRLSIKIGFFSDYFK